VRDEVERSGPGWLVTVLGASLLLFAGFAVGVVVGAAREEPELWLRHVSGETDSVTPDPALPRGDAPAPSTSEAPAGTAPIVPPPVEAGAPAAAPTTTAAAPARPAAPVVSAPLPSRALEPPPLGAKPKSAAAAAVASPPSAAPTASPAPAAARTGRFAVQVGAFADGAQAEGLARKLEKRGLPVQVLPGSGAKDSRWRVRVGPLDSREEADRVAAKLRDEKLPTWILAEGR